MEHEDEEVLAEEAGRRIVRYGDRVLRPTYPWSASVHELLRFLERRGFAPAPRFLRLDGEGREMLSFLPGQAGAIGWSKVVPIDGLVAFAHLLRAYHSVVADYRPAGTPEWSVGQAGVGAGQIVCHGDFAPWNIVWREATPVGILDWDHARPGQAVDDVAYAAEHVVPFRDDATCLRWLAYSDPPDRRTRLQRFAEAYGTDPLGIPDRVLALQTTAIDAVARLAACGIEPQATWVARGHLDELRTRFTWTESNRGLFT